MFALWPRNRDQDQQILNTRVVHHVGADNVGDHYCAPDLYLPFKDVTSGGYSDPPRRADLTVIGGGNVFDVANKYSRGRAFRRSKMTAAWGIGLPAPGRRDAEVSDFADRFTHFSTRDHNWSSVFDFVPCASCLSPAFDNPPNPTQETVLFLHRRKTPEDLLNDPGLSILTNRFNELESVVRFLSAGEVIVTNSYHGTYWAQLLGRRVVCIPFGAKFHTFQNPPTYATFDNWRDMISQAVAYPSELEEHRALNKAFFEKVHT